ncbi:hypothetical protein QP918_03370 [Corynebacterium accolens]|uniref:hypothetical protein n=1 Tax=Corynebacterium accolens TaxID=38284 RepID=UPI00254F59AD|nr:hypothetical protein [Corynebacterium accolens]MDK8674494.1 hypothetical protein [Corynebacterium accolens]
MSRSQVVQAVVPAVNNGDDVVNRRRAWLPTQMAHVAVLIEHHAYERLEATAPKPKRGSHHAPPA